ncbi:hypothetical protein LCGC14_2178630, partial [marine sediment metagenome]
LRANLYKSTELNMNEKSKLIKIIQKRDISEEDREVIKSLLGRLSKNELITLLKNGFLNSEDFKYMDEDPPLMTGEIIDISKRRASDTPFTINIKELQGFLKYYIENYNNIYSKRFKNLDFNRNKIVTHQVYIELARKIIQNGQIPCIVYEICDNKKGWIRIGWSSHSPDERMKWYLIKSFSPNLPPNMANIYYEMAKSGSKRQAQARFDMRVRYVFPTKGEALIMEEFLTIFRNRANNPNGYDLTINNEYNKIVGDLFKRGIGGSFPLGSLNSKWRDVPPIPLADAVLHGSEMNELETLFVVSSRTIRRRFRAYGYGVKGTYDLKDARAFLLKSIIIKGFKMGLDQEEFFKYCENEGIEIFNQFNFIKNKSNDRGAFFRRMIDQIWGTSKHKEARYSVIADFIISVINRIDINPSEAETELSKIITFKYEGEMSVICRSEFGMDFRRKRDEIFKLKVESLALKYNLEPNIQLKIAIGLGLCREDDPISIKDKKSHWVAQYTVRNYGIRPTQLPYHLDSKIPKYKSLKQQIIEFMVNNPIARPLEVLKHFEGKNIQTIGGVVKNWKKNNKGLILGFSITLVAKYIKYKNLGRQVEILATKLFHDYISIESPALNMEWKGIIAGCIYLACRMSKVRIS